MTSDRPRCPQSRGPRCSFIEPHRAATPPLCPRLAPFLALSLILNARGKDSQEGNAHSGHYAWHSASAIIGLSHLLSSCHTSCPESHWLAHFRALWCAHVSLTSSPPSQQPCLPLSLRDNVGYGEHTARQGLLGTPPSPFLIRGAAMSHLWASGRDSQA